MGSKKSRRERLRAISCAKACQRNQFTLGYSNMLKGLVSLEDRRTELSEANQASGDNPGSVCTCSATIEGNCCALLEEPLVFDLMPQMVVDRCVQFECPADAGSNLPCQLLQFDEYSDVMERWSNLMSGLLFYILPSERTVLENSVLTFSTQTMNPSIVACNQLSKAAGLMLPESDDNLRENEPECERILLGSLLESVQTDAGMEPAVIEDPAVIEEHRSTERNDETVSIVEVELRRPGRLSLLISSAVEEIDNEKIRHLVCVKTLLSDTSFRLARPINMVRVNFDIRARFLALRRLDKYVVRHEKYRTAVTAVIKLMTERSMTLNHVSSTTAFEDLTESGSLRSPALECMLGRTVTYLDKDDICKGIGYYHFSRVSAGNMKDAPNFNLNYPEDVMFFIDPRVLLERHFIVCKGNVAKSSMEDAPGRLTSRMTEDAALEEALRAVKKLKHMITAGVDNLHTRNEVAVFQGVESEFVYPHVAVLSDSSLRSATSEYADTAFLVTPMTGRHEAGKEAMRRKAAAEKVNVSIESAV